MASSRYQLENEPAVASGTDELSGADAEIVSNYGAAGSMNAMSSNKSQKSRQLESEMHTGTDDIRDSSALLQDDVDLEGRYQFDSRLTISQSERSGQSPHGDGTIPASSHLTSSSMAPPVDFKQSQGLVSSVMNTVVDDALDENSWLRHPKVKEHWKPVLGAFTLLFVGTALILTGVVIALLPYSEVKSYVFLVVGILFFIPGAYHVGYIYLSVKGRFGLTPYNIPLFN